LDGDGVAAAGAVTGQTVRTKWVRKGTQDKIYNSKWGIAAENREDKRV
jgi:hypothetical protein